MSRRGPATHSAHDVGETCRAAVDHLAAVPGLLPSIYLERGGRLRCQAIRGYWQVRDGIAPGTGVIGEVFRTGRASVVDGSEALTAHYLPAAEAVVAEVALPLWVGGRVVGVLNVESQRAITSDEVAEIRRTASRLEDQLAALGGMPLESAAQRLVRHAADIAALGDTTAVEHAVLVAAVDVLSLDSAMLLLTDGDEGVRAGPAIGPLGATLRQASTQSLAAVAGFVIDGTSAYTVGSGGGAPAGLQAVRGAGVGALGAVKLGEDRVLLVAGSGETPPTPDEMEQLELLALHAAVVLRTVALVHALRAEAASDPLTGLGHHGAFYEAIGALDGDAPMALLVADLDGFKTYNDQHGHPAGDLLLRTAARALSHALRRDDELYRIGGDEFAGILRLQDGNEALDVARRVHATFDAADLGLGVSVGVAVRAPGESAHAVLARADGALYEVKRDGRDGVRLADAGSVAALAPRR